MKISIIIPVYNTEKYIDECMESILKEMDSDIEVLLIDDGSTDNSYELIQKYKSKNIHIFHHENHGVSYTRNRGLEEATGDYVMFVDSDDMLEGGWKDVVCCKNYTEDVIYFSDQLNSEKVEKQHILENIFSLKSNVRLGNMSSPCSKLYNRLFILKHEIFFQENIINGEDALFNLQVVLAAKSFHYVKKLIYKYRLYGSSSTHRYNEKFFASNLAFLKVAEKLLISHGINAQRFLARSVVYSGYLYIYLISTIKGEKTGVIKKLKDDPINKYFDRFWYSSDCQIQENLVYICLKLKRYSFALFLMNVRNRLRKEGVERWGSI